MIANTNTCCVFSADDDLSVENILEIHVFFTHAESYTYTMCVLNVCGNMMIITDIGLAEVYVHMFAQIITWLAWLAL